MHIVLYFGNWYISADSANLGIIWIICVILSRHPAEIHLAPTWSSISWITQTHTKTLAVLRRNAFKIQIARRAGLSVHVKIKQVLSLSSAGTICLYALSFLPPVRVHFLYVIISSHELGWSDRHPMNRVLYKHFALLWYDHHNVRGKLFNILEILNLFVPHAQLCLVKWMA